MPDYLIIHPLCAAESTMGNARNPGWGKHCNRCATVSSLSNPATPTCPPSLTKAKYYMPLIRRFWPVIKAAKRKRLVVPRLCLTPSYLRSRRAKYHLLSVLCRTCSSRPAPPLSTPLSKDVYSSSLTCFLPSAAVFSAILLPAPRLLRIQSQVPRTDSLILA